MGNTVYLGDKSFNPESRYAALAKVLAKNYISVVEVDLRTGHAVVLKSREDLEFEGRELQWGELLERYSLRKTYPEDRTVVLSPQQKLQTPQFPPKYRQDFSKHSAPQAQALHAPVLKMRSDTPV